MTVGRKFIDLKDLKVSSDGSGSIEGYRAVFSEIDEGGDLIVKGFFAESIPEYLRSGFTAHSHDWDFDKAVGFPVKAQEDDHGFLVESQFHSTPDAQVVRTKAVERMSAGKQVGFSFGYTIQEKSYIEAKDYKEQLPQYVKADRLQANLLKAQQFDRIRILKKGEVMEDSIVTAPMNRMAAATGVKSEEEKPFDQQLKGVIAGHTHNEILTVINDGLDESEKFYLKGISGTEADESFESVGTVLKKFTDDMQRNHAARVKEGRILSTSNRNKVQAAYDALGELLTASEPPPKEKEIDVIALRTQSLRLRSQVSRTLAHL